MSKPKLGIDIDEVLRAKWLAFDRYYVDEFGEENEDGERNVTEPFDTYDFKNHYKFKDTEITEKYVTEEFLEHKDMQNVSPLEYIVNPETGRASVDDFAFNTEKKTMTAEEMFEKFLYEDYMFEIHGSAPKLYMNADVDLNVFLKLFGEFFDVYFYVKSKAVAIRATLFFLSKQVVEIRNIKIVSEDSEVWDTFDWVMTTNPDILKSKPEGKFTVKLTRQYNVDVDADYTANGGVYELNQPAPDDSTKSLFRDFIKDKLKLNK